MKFLAAIFAFVICASASAYAQTQSMYLEGTWSYTASDDLNVGGSNIPMDSGYLAGFAIGGLLANAISLELETTYGDRDAKDYPVAMTAFAVMLNTYYNFQIANAVGGYFGGGIGGAHLELEDGPYSNDEIVFAYQLMVGLTYAVNNIILFTEYRYQASQDANIGSTDVEYNTHNVGFGVRIPFSTFR